jgi:hypothetical protein
MKYILILLILMPCSVFKAAAKLRLSVTGVEHNGADTDTVIRKQSATVGVSYGSDVQFFGRTGPITYPFVSADAIYNTKNGIFIYASGLKVLGYNPFFDEIDAGAGYLYNISKNFKGSASYTRFFFNKDAAQIIKSASSNDINWDNSYNWGIAKSGVILDYLFGKESDVFVTLNTSKYIESKFSIFDDKDYLSINPGVSAILGTQNFVQRYAVDHQYQMETSNLFANDPDDQLMAHSNSLFKLLNYSFKLPIAYNRPHYTFEFAYKYSIPINVEGILMNHHESFYNLTFYYVFF